MKGSNPALSTSGGSLLSTALKQAVADIKAQNPAPLYFFSGDEPFKIDEAVSRLKEAASAPVEILDGAELSAAEVLESIQTLGLFGGAGGKKFVFVRNAHQLKSTESLQSELESAKAAHWGDSVLVFSGELDGRKKLHQLAKKRGWCFEFKRCSELELLQWVSHLAKKKGVFLDEEAVRFLAMASEGSLYRLSNEIDKIAVYLVGSELSSTTVTRALAGEISYGRQGFEMSDLVRAVLEKKRARALIMADRLIVSHEEALGFVGFTTWALKYPTKFSLGPVKIQNSRKVLGLLLELDHRLKSSGGRDAKELVEGFLLAV